MISPHSIVITKTVTKGAVILVALEIAAYEISPEKFSTIAVGVSALGVMCAAVATVLMNNRSNKKNREQIATIAGDQAEALRLYHIILQKTDDNTSRLDGRLSQLLAASTEMAEALGVKKERARAAEEATHAADKTAARDEKIVAAVADKAADRIGAAVDDAAKTVPSKAAKNK